MENQSKSQCTILSWVFAICVLCTFSLRRLAVCVAPQCFCTLCRCIKYLDIFCFYCASCFWPVSFCVGWFTSLVFWIVTDNTLQLYGSSACHGKWLLEICVSVPLSPILFTCPRGAEARSRYLGWFAPFDFITHLSNNILPLL